MIRCRQQLIGLMPTLTIFRSRVTVGLLRGCCCGMAQVRAETKPREKEIIIDVPLALKISGAGLGWPARAFTELRNGSLTEDDVRHRLYHY